MTGLIKGLQPYNPTWTNHGSSGARNTLTLPVSSTTNATLLFLGGVPQLAGSDYTISGTTLSLSSTLADGIEAVTCILYDLGSVTTPAAGSVNFASLGFTGEAQGQILYRDSSSWAVLAPGTSGQVLQTGGSSANPSWTNVSSDFVKIHSITASGADEVKFTSSHFDNSTYSSYEFRFLNLTTSSNGDTFYAKTSTDGGSSFDTGYDWSVMESNTNTGTDYTDSEAEGNNFIQLTSASNWGSATNEHLSGRFYIFSPGSTAYTHMNWHISYQDDQAGAYWTNANGSAVRNAAADVDGIQFEPGSGTISGTVNMYGVK
jgi:hypothetical protein